jgi:hypothetical protein
MDIIHLFISDILLGFIFYGETKISDHPIKAKKCFLDIDIYIQWVKRKVVEMTEQHRRDYFNAVDGARAFYKAFELFRAKPGILLGIDAQLCNIFPFLQCVVRRDVYIDKYIDMLEILCDDKEGDEVKSFAVKDVDNLRDARKHLQEDTSKNKVKASNIINQLRDDKNRAPVPEPAPVLAPEPAPVLAPEPAPISLLKEEAQRLGISNVHIRSEPLLRRLISEARADTINYKEYTIARLQELSGSRAKTKSHLINTLKNLKESVTK